MKKILVIMLVLIMLIPSNILALSLSCRSCILMDMDSGRILYEKDIDNPRLIASITKIMTAILAIESGKLDEIVTVGEEVLTMYGSNIYIELGERMKLRDLVYGLMMRSGNDAAIVIATYLAGSEEEFVNMMNVKANKIGMKNTIYNNCHGLDENTQNKSTARDMAILSSYASMNKTYLQIVGTKKYTVKTDKKTYIWTNRNKLLFDYKYATGGKTGYTPSAGRTLVTTASKDGLNLTSVTLNDGNEYVSHQTMYDYGFQNYSKYKIIDKNKIRIDNAYYKDKVYTKKDFYYPLTEFEKDSIKVKVILNKLIGYNDGDQIGTISVTLAGKLIYKDKVYVSVKQEKKKNLFERLKKKIFN